MDDEDLARAIALSLQDHKEKRPEVITIDDSDDEQAESGGEDAEFQAQLRRAMEESKAEAAKSSTNASDTPPTQPPAASSSNGGAASFLAQRAQLERERLERQRRQQGKINTATKPSASEAEDTDAEESEDEDERPAKRRHLASSSFTGKLTQEASSSKASLPEDQIFWNGELRQTATQYAEPRGDGLPTFRLTQVLGQKSELAFAIVSSYALDVPWLYEFFNPSVPVIVVAQPDANGQASIKNILPHWIKTTPPLRNGFGCQHMKFMLLFYKTGRLRVVISTANLIAYDWRDMENSVWLQDVPLRRAAIPHDPKADDFPAALQRMLHSINVSPALKTMINDNHPNLPIKHVDELRQRWDWSLVKVHLIASIAGKHEGWPTVIKTGHPALMMAVRKMGMRTGKGPRAKTLTLECQGSSLGNYTTQWLNEFHWSARGESAEDWLKEPKARREKLPYPPIKVVFPTKKTVQESAAGEIGGGTIFCRRKQWSAKNFPRENFYDSKSKAGPALMHSKMISGMLQGNAYTAKKSRNYVPSDSEDEVDDDIQEVTPGVGWIYVGSHNFTPSAWGTMSGTGFTPILNISNYEVGIVFPVKDEAEANKIACFQRPPKKYVAQKDEPWMQEESVYHQ
ncbi:tyrosyl-DNA phosphodiesterase-domain-containing protein [Ephemerocybe angulata]|uniref:Tyrosyl-DNA phosphodiesterase-domain-containing protein n=1 Tax=Ephemerocybe angulata TaxID=980116 RepID=A0A8H6HPM0_9AGAR|nr:tyrosyl-DNA phosphodiesterase-domain-containing protein [Tulosesus angulatus]